MINAQLKKQYIAQLESEGRLADGWKASPNPDEYSYIMSQGGDFYGKMQGSINRYGTCNVNLFVYVMEKMANGPTKVWDEASLPATFEGEVEVVKVKELSFPDRNRQWDFRDIVKTSVTVKDTHGYTFMFFTTMSTGIPKEGDKFLLKAKVKGWKSYGVMLNYAKRFRLASPISTMNGVGNIVSL